MKSHYQVRDVHFVKRGAVAQNNNQLDMFPRELNDAESWLTQLVFIHYRNTLAKNPRAQGFLKKNHIDYKPDNQKFRLGYCGRVLDFDVERLSPWKEDIFRKYLQCLGLLDAQGHDIFRGCVVFPHINFEGVITGAYGRRIHESNTGKAIKHIHWRNDHTSLFNESALYQFQEIIFCKNALDAMSLWSIGVENVVASLGHLDFNKRYLLALKESGVSEVYIAFGSDKASLSIADFIADTMVDSGLRAKVIDFEAYSDVSDCLHHARADVNDFIGLMNRAVPH